MIPSGFNAIICSAVYVEGTVITSRPRFKSSRRMLALAPKSQSTTFLPLPSFIASSGSLIFVPSAVTGTKRYLALSLKTTSAGSSTPVALPVTEATAFTILYSFIFSRRAAFFDSSFKAANASTASFEEPLISMPFITPASLRIFVSLRVSIS